MAASLLCSGSDTGSDSGSEGGNWVDDAIDTVGGWVQDGVCWLFGC